MQNQKLRARYKVVGPKTVPVQYNKCWMDENGSLQQKVVTEEKPMYMVYFPQGHSIRVDRDELIRLGFHKKPRIVDMTTGDVLQIGDDYYDLDDIQDINVELNDDPFDEQREVVNAMQESRKG